MRPATDDLKKQIDQEIRGHYFDEECKHESYEKCCAYLIGKIMKLIDYKPRSEIHA